MIARKYTVTLIALTTTAGLLGRPAESQAICHLFNRQPTVTNYAPVVAAPVVAAPACNSCAAPTVVNYAPAQQVCNYVPQTAYRSVYVNVPVTSYRPIVAADPCTGCATTAMQPVTTYMTQSRLVPYTTYRPVMATVNYAPVLAAPACNTCASPAPVTTMMPATTYSVPTTISPGCSSCATGVSAAPISTTITSAPTISGPIGSTTTGAPVIQSPVIVPGAPGSTLHSLQTSPTPAPSSATSDATSGADAKTFAPNGNGDSSSDANSESEDDSPADTRLKPIPDTSTSSKKSGYSVPRSNFGDRTTSVQVKRTIYQASASRAPAVGPVDENLLDDSGWRAARK